MAKIKVPHSFPTYEAFREAVDAALDSLGDSSVPDGLLRYPASHKAIQAAISAGLERTLGSNEPIPDIDAWLHDLAEETTYAHELNGSPLEPYFSVAHTLRDALARTGATSAICSADPRWIEALRISCAYNSEGEPAARQNKPQARYVTVAEAVKFFNDRRIAIAMKGPLIRIDGHEQALSRSIGFPLSSLGDTISMQVIDNLLEQRFDHLRCRLRLHPTPDSVGHKSARQIPYGLLYRYGLKSLGQKSTIVARQSAVGRSILAAKHLAALYDVEPFSVFGMVNQPKISKILDVLREIVVFDELFAIPQCQPDVMKNLFDKLLTSIPSQEEASAALGWSIEDAWVFFEMLLVFSTHFVRSTFVDTRCFRSMLVRRVGASTAESLLKAFVVRRPNARYQLPTDARLADTRECAIAEASGNRFWIPGQLMLGPAFYARLVATRKKYSPKLSEQLGDAFEVYLIKRLTDIGITCRRGYIRGAKKGSRAGDADLVMETNDVVGLFELKKKGLCWTSNGGDILQLAIDLAQGLVHGVNQLAKHEITLLKTGQLCFESGPPLVLGARRIVKGVISLADYGGLHDASVVHNALACFVGARVVTQMDLTSEKKKELEEVNREFELLAKRWSEFDAVRNDKVCGRNLVENLVFSNIFFIEYLLTKVNTAEDVLRSLSMGSRIVTGMRDQFFENAQFDPLRMPMCSGHPPGGDANQVSARDVG